MSNAIATRRIEYKNGGHRRHTPAGRVNTGARLKCCTFYNISVLKHRKKALFSQGLLKFLLKLFPVQRPDTRRRFLYSLRRSGLYAYIFLNYSALKGSRAATLARLIAVESSRWCFAHVPLSSSYSIIASIIISN